MKISRIRQLEQPETELMAVDRWDRTALADQLQDAEELGLLLEKGVVRLRSFWGVMADLFTILFAGEPHRKPGEAHPGLMVNALVLDTIWTMPELQSLRIHTMYRRNEVTAALIRFGEAILEAIPPEVPQHLNGIPPPEQQEGEGEGDGGGSDQDSDGDAGEEPGDGPQGPNPGGDGSSGDEPSDDNNEGDSEGSGDKKGKGKGKGPGMGPGNNPPVPNPAGSSCPSPASAEAKKKLEESLRRIRPSLNRAVKQACQRAQKDAKDMADMQSSQGWDLSKADPEEEDPSATWKTMKALLECNELRQIYNQAGNKLRTLAMAAQEQKPVGKGFVAIDRTIGSDLENVPMDELMVFAHPSLDVLVLQALADGTLPQEDFQEEFERESGDIKILYDISGSTAGAVSRFIKGIVLAFQAIAHHQGRDISAIAFNSEVREEVNLTKAKPYDLIKLAKIAANGGTNFQKALEAGIQSVVLGGNVDCPPDIILITDGICAIPSDSSGRPSGSKDWAQQVRQAMKDKLGALGTRLKVIYVGVDPSQLTHRDVGEIAGAGNETFLSSLNDWEKLRRVFEQI